jgi:hypothetical protein
MRRKTLKRWCLFQQLLDPVSKAYLSIEKCHQKIKCHIVLSDFSSVVGDNSHSTLVGRLG